VAIEILPYTPEWIGPVAAFNRRMKEGGSSWGWYETDEPDWIPPREGRKVWREYYLAVENREVVRGAFALKPQEFLIHGEPHVVADWQGPVSEGVIDRRFSALGLRIFREIAKLRPLHFSWGHGGYDQEMPRMLRSLGFLMHDTPFCLRVLRPARFLRRNRYLRDRPGRRAALDLLAATGLGWVGFEALHRSLALASLARPRARAEVVPGFAPWADEVWERCRGSYAALAVRDAATLDALMPPGGWPPATRLRVTRGGEVVGWIAVMDRALHDEPRFGDLRVGLLLDSLARPEDAAAVVGAGFRHLADAGVDLVFANQSHPAWIAAMRANGFLVLPRKRLFAASKPLEQALEPFAWTQRGLLLSNLDGHGPMGL